MASITSVAEAFFAACETGKGWEVCSAYCMSDATFRAQAEPLLELKTLAQYTDWMKGIMTVLPDGHYEVKSFATDAARNNVAAYGVFHGIILAPAARFRRRDATPARTTCMSCSSTVTRFAT